MLKSVDDKCASLKTHPELRTVLVTSLHDWLAWDNIEDGPPFHIAHQSASTDHIKRLITRQNDIGWHQLFLGRFCNDWSEIQEAHYATMINSKEGKQRTGLRWQTTIIGEMWTQWYVVWEMRNKDLHGETSNARARAE